MLSGDDFSLLTENDSYYITNTILFIFFDWGALSYSMDLAQVQMMSLRSCARSVPALSYVSQRLNTTIARISDV